MKNERLTGLQAGMPIVYGGNRVTHVDTDLADRFQEGDLLIVTQDDGSLLHVPAAELAAADGAVAAARRAFDELGSVQPDQLRSFFDDFASLLADESVFAHIADANRLDVEKAEAEGRAIGRLVLSERMRTDMIDGLRIWRDGVTDRETVVESHSREGLRLESVRAGLGVVGFVFEGRPNVFADATGVLVGRNTVALRIGSAALGTARAIMSHAIEPALNGSDLPAGSVSLVDSKSRAAGWALFADTRLSLAVARGSGKAVSQLGAVAKQSGTPTSLHGTGGAWIVAGESANVEALSYAVVNSLDRKVCNTVNTICVVEQRASECVPAVVKALDEVSTSSGSKSKMHVTPRAVDYLPDGRSQDPDTFRIDESELGREWEWEGNAEISLTVVDDLGEAVDLFNTLSPRLAASLISSDEAEHERFFDSVEAPFVGSGFTRWVDGQYAFGRPELGLSSWEEGRLLGRGGVLSGDSIFSVRTRAVQSDPDLSR